MQLSDLRTAVRDRLFDASSGGDYWTDARLTRVINQAMHYVANVVAGQRPAHFYVEHSEQINNVDGANRWVQAQSVATPVRRLVYGETPAATGHDKQLKEIDFGAAAAHLQKLAGATTNRPPIFLFGTGFGYLAPTHQTTVKVVYEASLPAMSAATDTPGQSAGGGTANLLPEHFQGLIITQAAIICLATYGLPTGEHAQLLIREAAAAGVSLDNRTQTPEGGR